MILEAERLFYEVDKLKGTKDASPNGACIAVQTGGNG